MRQTIPNLTFAIFTDGKRARAAEAALEDRIANEDLDIRLLTKKGELEHGSVSRQTFWTRAALITGAALVAGLLFAAIMGVAWLSLGAEPDMLVPWEAMLVGVMLSALFGGLAGTLSLMVEIRATMHRLRRGLAHGRTILFVESDYDLDRELERHGAAETGTVM